MTSLRPHHGIQGIGALAVALTMLVGCTAGGEPQASPGAEQEAPDSPGEHSGVGEPDGGASAGEQDGSTTGADSGTGAGADAGAGGPQATATLLVQPQGFARTTTFRPRDGWVSLGSDGQCAVSSTVTSQAAQDQSAAERDVSRTALGEVLSAERRASDRTTVSEVLVADGTPGEPRGMNAVVQEWTVERADAKLRSRVLVRSVWSPQYSGEIVQVSWFVAFECNGPVIDEASWSAALAQLRLPVAGGETAGAWRDE